MRKSALVILLSVCHGLLLAQDQGFFLSSWKPATITSPAYTNTTQTTDPATVSLIISNGDTLSKIPEYLFGDNANLWTGTMSDNKTLMQFMIDRRMGVLRGPGGSASDVYFWNCGDKTLPADLPAKLAGQSEAFSPWYGIRPNSWENWTMAADSFYSILKQTGVTGMQTVNYGYARYGIGPAPVATAAHMAAQWVRFDKGRSRFWEIGNEVFGSWEAGYRIDKTINKDGQPEYITPSLYGQHCLVFIDSMKSAVASLGIDIRIGVVMAEASGSASSNWNRDVAAAVGDKADFYSVHSYFTPYNQNSSAETILNSYHKTGSYKRYVYSEIDKVSKAHIPVALTEYNIFATGSKQAVSHVNGMHAALVTGEAMKTGLGAALRWDLANGWDNGNDHGMFSFGNEPGVVQYAPRPAFYHLYFMRRFTGDILLNSTRKGDTNVVIFPTAFSTGHLGITLVNKGRGNEVLRLNASNFTFGERYYTYTLTGEAGIDFSRKVFVNGTGNNLVAGGPLNYRDIPALSSVIDKEIKVVLPPLSSVFVLIEPGDKVLAINEDIYSTGIPPAAEKIVMYPNPAHRKLYIGEISDEIDEIRISDCFGRIQKTVHLSGSGKRSLEVDLNLQPGLYTLILAGKKQTLTRKLIIR